MSEYSGVERRKYRRVKVNLTIVYRKNESPNVRIRDDKGENDAAMVDIGEGGIAIITTVNVLVGTELLIRFTLVEAAGEKGGFYGDFELLGKVTSNITVDKDSYRLGIVFLNIDDRIKGNIANFVNTIESRLQGN
ncbi:MAG: PilZ domain-containing protein [Candidatus Helarchaeota archaeon]|nr:PilZ domain-containing protein [Candidatus Helarchaeota archaeon]